jgi:hypothetical protein
MHGIPPEGLRYVHGLFPEREDIRVRGSASKGRDIGYKDEIEAEGECLQVGLPVTISIQECGSKGERFTRVNVVDIGTNPTPIELKGSSDRCGLNKNEVKQSGWQMVDYSLPLKTTQTRP